MLWGWRGGGRRLGLSCLAVGVATVAFGLSRRLIFDHPRYTSVLGALASFGHGQRFGLRGCSLFCRLGLNALALLDLQAFALQASFLTSRDNGKAFCLPCDFTWFGRSFCSTEGIEESSLGVRGCCTAVRELAVSSFLQIFILIIGVGQ
jgi:hypothetical protein